MEKIEILEKLLEKADHVWWRLQTLYPDLRRYKTPTITLNGRFTRTAGIAYQEDQLIQLATKFLLHSPKYRQIMYNEILPHELAHIADYLLFGYCPEKCGHGTKWAEIMVQLGLKPNKFHSMDLTK